MTVSKKLIENIEDVKKSLKEISVYDLNTYSMLELYYSLAKKINEIIIELSRFEGVLSEEIIKQNEKLMYLLGEGLTIEVIKKINSMLENGEFNDIINKEIFADLNSKIDVVANKRIGYVTYDQFGAVGDGVTDDYLKIKECHEYANENNLPVKASKKKYFISDVPTSIPVKTPTDWNGATIIIDEGNVGVLQGNAFEKNVNIFSVQSYHEPIVVNNLTGISITRGTKKIPQLAGNGNCVVDVINTTKKQFIRKGVNADNGYSQTDQFRIDNEGNVLDEIIWDFDYITSITLYPIDDEKLVVGNATFVTKENAINSTIYLQKGVEVLRSNTIVENISHVVEEGSSYVSPTRGIIYPKYCCDFLIRNCKLWSRRTQNSVGSYEISFYKVVNYIMDNVVDVNYLDSKRWGCHTQNYGKNATVLNSILSRYDAHKGVWNVTIRDTVLGFQGIRLIGGGLGIFENITSHAGTLITFRSDYGSNWNGRIRMKNIKHIPRDVRENEGNENKLVKLFYFNNDMNHDFGYTCYHTVGIQLENYYLYNYDENNNNGVFEIFKTNTLLTSDEITSEGRCRFPYEISLKNLKTNNGAFKVGECYISAFRVGTPFEFYETGETYSTSSRNLFIKNNCKIVVDDVKLCDVNDDKSNIINFIGLGRIGTDDYMTTNTRPLPLIELKNCDNVRNYVGGFPCILNIENCHIKTSNCNASGSRVSATYNSCLFEPTPADETSLIYRSNGVTTTFINCYFKKPIYQNGALINKDTFSQCYGFLGYNSVKSTDENFRSNCSFIGCRVDNEIHPNTLYPNTALFDYVLNQSYRINNKK
mgnify:CR=1 FL=1